MTSNKQNLNDAYKYLGTYLASGLTGFFQKALDRMSASGINLANGNWKPCKEHAEILREHLVVNSYLV